MIKNSKLHSFIDYHKYREWLVEKKYATTNFRKHMSYSLYFKVEFYV